MLRPRIIPCLLVQNNGLVKTRRFEDPKYVGDPINAVKIFNEKEVDEIVVLDIDASVKGVEPNYDLIEKLAAECRMPLCYGGGIRTPEQAFQIISTGVEKVAISSVAVDDPKIVSEIAAVIGSQSVVVVIDVKKTGMLKRHQVFTLRGKNATGLKPVEFAETVASLGAGEVVINSIDRDGVGEGYDIELARQIREAVDVPITVLGGAGKLVDIGELIRAMGIVGACAGSLFVFKGKYRAVLISYPDTAEKERLINDVTISQASQ